MEPFQSFLNTLAISMQFPSLEPDQEEACLIEMRDGNTELLFDYDDHLVPYSSLVFTPITEIQNLNRDELLKQCLMGNWKLEPTLSKRPDYEEIYLHQPIHPEIPLKDLGVLLEQFIHSAQTWRLNLKREEQPT